MPRAHTVSRSRSIAVLGRLLSTLVCLLLAAGAGGVFASAAHAADEDPTRSWLVQPAGPLGTAETRSYFVYALEPGAWVEDVVAIVNHSEEPLELSLFGTDAFTNPDNGTFGLLASEDSPEDVGSWVTLATDTVTVPPRARMEVPFMVQVPVTATPGDHAGGIVTSYVSTVVDDDNKEVLFDARIAVRIYLTVAGELTPRLEVRDLETTFDLSSNGLTGTLTVDYVVANDGNLRLGGDESISVTGPFGVAARESHSTIEEVLPRGYVRRQAVFADVPATGWLNVDVAVAPVDIGGRLGDQQVPSAVGARTVVAVPWIWLAGVILVVSLVTWRIRARRRRWKAMKAELDQARAGSATAAPAADTVDTATPGTG